MPHVLLARSGMAAQVLTGVGLLGAGSILMQGNVMRGSTTVVADLSP